MRQRQAGFSYLIAMFLVAVLGVLSLRGLQSTLTWERREREAQLLNVGAAYYRAIRDYYEGSPGTAKSYPPTLDALLLDERTTTLRRHLRKLYRDPVTGTANWGIVRAPDGGVMGVFSLSTHKPVKTGGFPLALRGFQDARKYQDWQFAYQSH